jgi:allantoicase
MEYNIRKLSVSQLTAVECCKCWAVFQLSHCGYITHIEVDTYHFKGNYPDSIRIEGTTENPHTDLGQAT